MFTLSHAIELASIHFLLHDKETMWLAIERVNIVYDILGEVINKLYDRRYQHKDIAEFSGVNPATLNRIRSSPITGYAPKYETLVKIKAYFDALDRANNEKLSEKFSGKGAK